MSVHTTRRLSRPLRRRRSLGAVAAPPGLLQQLQEGLRIKGMSEQLQAAMRDPRAQEEIQERIEAGTRAALAPAQARAAMFGWDAAWNQEARWTDARVCITRQGGFVPYGSSDCSGTPICEWGFYQVQVPCDRLSFADVLFQEDRYYFVQEQLNFLLQNKPPDRSTAYATQWADWTIEVFRLVSMARWATNISADYQKQGWGPATSQKMKDIGEWSPGPGVGSRIHPEDIYPNSSRHILSLWMPRDLNNIHYPDAPPPIPLNPSGFDPVSFVTPEAQTRIGLQVHPAWPRRWVPWPGDDVRAQMIAWFKKTISGGYWFHDNQNLVEYFTRRDCSFTLEASNVCAKQARTSFWYGTGAATVAIAEAMARDVVNRSFASIVAEGLELWLDKYEALPPDLRILNQGDIDAVRASVAEFMRTAVHTASGVLALAGAATAGMTTIMAAVLSAVTELLILLDAAAIGGAELAAACLSNPMVRTIPVPDVDGLQTCDFDLRTTATPDRPITFDDMVGVIGRLDAVRDAAARELPVDAWFEASKRSGQGNIAEMMVPPPMLPPPRGKKVPWTGLLAAGAVVFGGVFLYGRSR